MKKTLIVALLGLGIAGTTLSSCGGMTTAGVLTSVGLSVLQQILLGGISQGTGIFNNPQAFLSNALVEAAMPQELRQLNRTLENIGMGSLVQKEKQYLAQAAGFAIETARPILVNAVNNMTAADAAAIVAGGRGAATEYLRRTTQQQIVMAMTPKIDQKLNEYGITRSINSALSATGGLNSLLESITGQAPSTTQQVTGGGLSQIASEYMAKGLFNIIENYERANLKMPMGGTVAPTTTLNGR